jgi:hypothetical protein
VAWCAHHFIQKNSWLEQNVIYSIHHNKQQQQQQQQQATMTTDNDDGDEYNNTSTHNNNIEYNCLIDIVRKSYLAAAII